MKKSALVGHFVPGHPLGLPTSQDELIIVQPPRILYDAGLIGYDEVITAAIVRPHCGTEGLGVPHQLRHLLDAGDLGGGEEAWPRSRSLGGLEPLGREGQMRAWRSAWMICWRKEVPRRSSLDSTWPASPPEYVEAGGPATKFLGMEAQK